MLRLRKPWKRRRAITLVELLVAIVVIAIVGTMVYMQFGDAVGQARNTRNINDAGRIKEGADLFFAQTGEYPVGANDATAPFRVFDLLATATASPTQNGWGLTLDPGKDWDDYWVVVNIDKLIKPYLGADGTVYRGFLEGVPRSSFWAASPVSSATVIDPVTGVDSTPQDGYYRNVNHDTTPVIYVINVATTAVGYYAPTNPQSYEATLFAGSPPGQNAPAVLKGITITDPRRGVEYSDQNVIYPAYDESSN